MGSLNINAEWGPPHSSEASLSTTSSDAVDPCIQTTNQTTDDLAQCMRFLSQPDAVLSVVARIGTVSAQTPAYTPTDVDDDPEKHADPHQSSCQSPLPTVPQSSLHFPPSLPIIASTESSLLAAHSLGDEHASDTLPIASESTTTVASVSELQLAPGDERSDLPALLRTPPTASLSSLTFGVAKTCKCLDPFGVLIPSSPATPGHERTPLLMDLDLCASTPANSQQADNPPDHRGTRHMRQDSMPSTSFVAPPNFPFHATAVPVPKTLVTMPASETDSATGAMDSGHLSASTPCSHSTLLPVDVRPPHDGPHDGLLAPSVPSGATLASPGPGMLEDLVTQDESPCSGRLPPSSLPNSQVSEFSPTASCGFASVSNPEDFGLCDDTAMISYGSIGSMAAQTPVTTDVLVSDFHGAVEGSCLTLNTPLNEDVALELPASSPPSSSPPGLFSSPAQSPSDSPPSSSPIGPPCYVEDHLPTPTIQYDDRLTQNSPSKRERVADESIDTASTSSPECRPFKRMKTELSPPATFPNPIRHTQASQVRQRKKLSAPFRSPVIKGPLVHGGLHAVYASGRTAAPTPASKSPSEEDTTAAPAAAESSIHVANKDRTVRAAKQFKPPMQVVNPIALSGSSSAVTVSKVSRTGAVPTIQALQGQVQTLKQAIKVKQSGDSDDDQVLEQLVEKWTAVGREVAWALWDHVKDLDPGTGAPSQGGRYADDEDGGEGLKRGFDPGWGYGDEEPVRKKARMDEDAEEEEPQVVEHTVGVMLRRLGIDPDTLGWNEDEGDFVDA